VARRAPSRREAISNIFIFLCVRCDVAVDVI